MVVQISFPLELPWRPKYGVIINELKHDINDWLYNTVIDFNGVF